MSSNGRRPLTSAEIETIYCRVRTEVQRRSLRFDHRCRNADDGHEAVHAVAHQLLLRAIRLWDRVRPLDAYIGASVGQQLSKFRARERQLEIPQDVKEPSL